MAINPNISLAVQPPKIPDPMEQMGRMLTLQNLMQQSKFGEQTAEENELKLQQMRKILDDEDKVREILSGSKDIRSALPQIFQFAGKTGISMARSLIEHETSLANLDETQAKTAKSKLDQFTSAIDEIVALPPELRNPAYQEKIKQLSQFGLLPAEMQQSLPPQWDDELMTKYGNRIRQDQAKLDKQIRETQAKRAQLELEQAQKLGPFQAQKAEAEAKTAAAEAAQGGKRTMHPITIADPKTKRPVPAVQEIRQDGTSRVLMGGVEIRDPYIYSSSALQSGDIDWLAINSFPRGEQGSGRNENVLHVVPPDVAERALNMADYRVPPPTGFGQRDPRLQAALAVAQKYDPDYDPKMFKVAEAALKDYGPGGKTFQNIRSLNTGLHHLGTLERLAKKLPGKDLIVSNEFVNWVRTQYGRSDVTNFETAKNALQGELAAIFKATGATDLEIRSWEEKYKASMSKGQLKGAIETGMELLAGRLGAIKSGWPTFMKSISAPVPYIDEESARIVESIGFDPKTLKKAERRESGDWDKFWR